MSWSANLNGEEADCLVIEFFDFKYSVNQCCFVRGDVKLVLRLNFPKVLVHVKKSYEDATKSLVHELEGRFPNHDLILALSVMYLNFWVDHPNDVENVSCQHLTIIKVAYSMLHKVGKMGVLVKALLDGHPLDVQCYFLKMKMVANSEAVMKEEPLMNLVTCYTPRSILLPSSSTSFMNSESLLKLHVLKSLDMLKISVVFWQWHS